MATTLIFVSAVTGNYASYVSYNHSHTASTEAVDSWYYDINKASLLDCLTATHHPRAQLQVKAPI